MAALNFPEATSNGQTFEADTGVIYVYQGNPPNGFWSATSTKDGQQNQDARYVQVAGDDMTGNLTFNTSQIELNAITGAATFVGTVQVGGSAKDGAENGVSIREAGLVQSSRDANNTVWAGYTTGNPAPTSTILGNGKATFGGGTSVINAGGAIQSAGGIYTGFDFNNTTWEAYITSNGQGRYKNDVYIGGDVVNTTADPNISLNADGSAAFAGTILTGDWVPGSSGSPGSTDYGNYIEGIGGYFTNRVDANSTVLRGYHQGTQNVNITAGGNATFAKNIQAGGNAAAGAENGSIVTTSGYLASSDNPDAPVFRGYTTGNATPTSQIKADGRSFFKGSAVIGAYDLSNATTGTGINLKSDGELIIQRIPSQNGKSIIDGRLGNTQTVQILASGAATFKGALTSGDTSTGCQLFTNGSAIGRLNGTQQWYLNNDGSALFTRSATASTEINANSSANLIITEGAFISNQPVGGYPTFQSKLSGTTNCQIFADGSARFNGNITVKWDPLRVASVFDQDYRQGMAFNTSSRRLDIFSTTNDSGGDIAFFTRVGAGTDDTDYGTERMRINSSGNVGIGTNDPYYKLHIVTTNSQTSLSGGGDGNWGGDGLRLENDDATIGSMSLLHFRTNDSDWHIGNKYMGPSELSDFIFLYEGTERMKITSDAARLYFTKGGSISEYIFHQSKIGLTSGTEYDLARIEITESVRYKISVFGAITGTDRGYATSLSERTGYISNYGGQSRILEDTEDLNESVSINPSVINSALTVTLTTDGPNVPAQFYLKAINTITGSNATPDRAPSIAYKIELWAAKECEIEVIDLLDP